MSAQQQQRDLRVVDAQTPDHPIPEPEIGVDADLQVAPSLYEDATEPDWSDYDRRLGAFIKNLLPRIGKEEFLNDEVHHFAQLEQLRLLDRLDTSETDDVDLAVLFVLPDDTVLFIGEDPTVADAPPQFGFAIERHQPIPVPDSAQDALDLLRPRDVRDAFACGETPDRQGEWWLLSTEKVPVSDVYEPGVQSKPFGPSPLDSHVPREYGFTVSSSEFMEAVRDEVPQLPASIDSPPELMEWFSTQQRRRYPPDHLPEWETIRDCAGDILVRGTLRHREHDHDVEQLGDDQWYETQTHDMDVYTGDDVGRVVLD